MPRDTLYSPIQTSATGFLDVEPPHKIYWEESGAADGVPVCFLHGGPGAGSAPGHRRFFDPEFYRIILHDQRGAGRSRPIAETRHNDTNRLISDMEALRVARGVDSWVLFGGSWGSSLALAYAQAYPARVRALVLRGIFLCRDREISWFLNGMGHFFPEEYHRFLNHLPEKERNDPLAGYLRRLNAADANIQGAAAESWARYEAVCSTLRPNASSLQSAGYRTESLALARIEAHYFSNRFFMREGQLLDHISRLKGIPAYIVQGRYDVVCPPISAFELVDAWDSAVIRIIDDAGHSVTEPGITAALVEAMDGLRSAL